MQIFVQAPIPGSSSLEFNQDRDDPQHLAPATEGARSMRAFGMLDESCPNSTQYCPHCSRAGRESTMPPSATLPLSHQRQLNCGQGTTCCPQRECVEDVKNDSSFRGAEGYCRQVTMKSRRDDTPMHNNPNAQQSQCTTIPTPTLSQRLGGPRTPKAKTEVEACSTRSGRFAGERPKTGDSTWPRVPKY